MKKKTMKKMQQKILSEIKKGTKANEDGWTKPLKFAPIAHFYIKVTKESKQVRISDVIKIIDFMHMKMMQLQKRKTKIK